MKAADTKAVMKAATMKAATTKAATTKAATTKAATEATEVLAIPARADRQKFTIMGAVMAGSAFF
jgi:hypothetical protein